MSRIRIHDISYDPQSRSIDYRASLRVPGQSITISARASLAKADARSISLRMIARRHAEDLLSKPGPRWR